jgi:hypothetical protein
MPYPLRAAKAAAPATKNALFMTSSCLLDAELASISAVEEERDDATASADRHARVPRQAYESNVRERY